MINDNEKRKYYNFKFYDTLITKRKNRRRSLIHMSLNKFLLLQTKKAEFPYGQELNESIKSDLP
uniref:Uncharacterized protein n=1 Tax=Schistosoma haematobium TaxID=6185 RepID=A0A095AT47_SCHHA